VTDYGEELILSVNAGWRRMRVFRPQGPILGAAVAETVTRLEARGWSAREVSLGPRFNPRFEHTAGSGGAARKTSTQDSEQLASRSR
jgi:hypothetical protein